MGGNRDRLILIHGAATAAGTVDRVASRVGCPGAGDATLAHLPVCLLYTSPSPRDRQKSRMPSSA
jgi:hypothetical protein